MNISWRCQRSRHTRVALLLCATTASVAGAGAPGAAASSADAPGSEPAIAPADGAAGPQESVFSSVRQAFKEDFEHEVIRGHFDVGSPPEVRRYYCLVDDKKGRRQPNGVSGQPMPRPDGMTGLKENAVSVYLCASAEQQGMLVTSPYILKGALAGAGAAVSIPAKQATVAPAQSLSDVPSGMPDAAGVRLGMTVDEVRAVLKSKKLHDYYESSEPLSKSGPHGAGPWFVSVIAAWTPAPSLKGDSLAADAESYEILFTPQPGRERAMAVIHSVTYSPESVLSEAALKGALAKKYGGYADPGAIPSSPTWILRSGAAVQTGDVCDRRSILAGRPSFNPAGPARRNLALTTTMDEFQYQVERCGSAVITEDHVLGSADAGRTGHVVTTYTVTAYSPVIGLEGAKTAAQYIQGPSGGDTHPPAPKQGESVTPNL